MSALADLLVNASPAIGDINISPPVEDKGLKTLLTTRNGYYAFDKALWVFASHSAAHEPGLDHPEIANWARKYPKTKGVSHAFAVDIFGYPYCVSDQGVLKLDLETGRFMRIGEDIEGWAKRVLDHFEQLTGWSCLKEWERENGALPVGYRLLPRLPFIGGGARSSDNLIAVPLTELIGFYAELAAQVRNLPDGAEIEIQDEL